jgi:adenylate cyclase
MARKLRVCYTALRDFLAAHTPVQCQLQNNTARVRTNVGGSRATLKTDMRAKHYCASRLNGTAESLHAVLWFADIRGFTPMSDASPGPIVIELLNDVFEVIAATLRSRGGEVLKFLGDGVLATLSFNEADRARTCHYALDAAVETMRRLEVLNATRAEAGLPTATVDVALHIGEVLYGNVGATDRLDFTVIGPAVNEVARIETLCGTLDRKVLVSAELAAAAAEDGNGRLEPLGRHALRGVREAREIFALDLSVV